MPLAGAARGWAGGGGGGAGRGRRKAVRRPDVSAERRRREFFSSFEGLGAKRTMFPSLFLGKRNGSRVMWLVLPKVGAGRWGGLMGSREKRGGREWRRLGTSVHVRMTGSNWGNKQRQLRLKRTLRGSGGKSPRVNAGQGGPV